MSHHAFKYFLFVAPIIWLLAFIQHFVMMKIPFHIKFYIVPTLASISISILIGKLRSIQKQKDEKEAEKQFFEVQKHYNMTLFTNKFLHDFKNIILGLNLNNESFEAIIDTNSKPLSDIFAKQNRYLTRAKDLLDQMSLFAELESDEIVDINLKDIFIDIQKIINTFTKGNVSFEIEINNYKTIRGIRSQIYQTFLNLCFNSSVAVINQDNAKLTIAISCPQDFPNRVQIEVIDSRLSYSLSQINNELTKGPSNSDSAMGLTYAQKVIKNHHGNIQALKNSMDQFMFSVLIPYDFENQTDL